MDITRRDFINGARRARLRLHLVTIRLTQVALPYSMDGVRLSDSRLADSLKVDQITIARPSPR